MSGTPFQWVTCPQCGKRLYSSKAEAKRVMRRLADRMSVYRCQVGGDGWHLGHLPRAVVAGEATRSDIHVTAHTRRNAR